MKKTTFILLTALAVGACNESPTSPFDTTLNSLDEAAMFAFSGSFVADPGSTLLPGVHRLPDNLKLSASQEAAIKALIEQFRAATKADHEALAAIMRKAKEAAAAGKSREEIKAILDQGIAIHQRLHAAESKLRTDILALLTAEQKAWLEANSRKTCTAPALTDSQRSEIAALVAAFEQANSADIAAVKAAFEQARAAKQSGATAAQVQAILDSAKPAMQRLRAAEVALAVAIAGVLTPDQRACSPFKGAAGGPFDHGPRK